MQNDNNKAIILLAFGKQGYGYMAFNMAMSIKFHGCTIPIHLYCAQDTFRSVPIDTRFFDHVHWVEPSFYSDKDGNLKVAKAKIEILNSLPCEHNIYLDVDGMAVKDLTPFIDEVCKSDKNYMTDVMGMGCYGQDISYDCWAKHSVAWPFFGLEKDAVWRTVQSSWAYFKKDEMTKAMYSMLRFYLEKGYPLKELKEKWASNQLPDELLFTGVCAKMDIDPACNIRPVFFGNYMIEGGIQAVIKNHYILSMYGNGNTTGVTLTKGIYQDWYSRETLQMARKYKVTHYKKEYVMRDKIVNF